MGSGGDWLQRARCDLSGGASVDAPRVARCMVRGGHHIFAGCGLVDGPKGAQVGRALILRSGKESRFQSVTADDRRGTADCRVVSERLDQRDSANVAATLRHRRNHRWHVFGQRGSGDGTGVFGAGCDWLVRAGADGELVDGGGFWWLAHHLWINYREEVRWLNKERSSAKYLKVRQKSKSCVAFMGVHRTARTKSIG